MKLGRGEEARALIEAGDALQAGPIVGEDPSPPTSPSAAGVRLKTLLFCTVFSSGIVEWRERYERWLRAIGQSSIAFDQLLMIDVGSPFLPQQRDIAIVRDVDDYPADAKRVLLALSPHLGRLAEDDIPGWYRSYSTAARIAVRFGFDKVVYIESDAFIISERLQRYINLISDGWVSVWCETHSVPEAGVEVMAGEGMRLYDEFVKQPHAGFVSKSFERILPFTRVERGFRGGRYGERLNYVPRNTDWTMQTYSPLPVPERYFWWLRFA